MGLLPMSGGVWESISAFAESIPTTQLDSPLRLAWAPNRIPLDSSKGFMSRAFLDKGW